MTTAIVTHDGLNDAQRTILTQTTPSNVIRHRPGRGGQQLAYVTHAYVNRLLNEAFGHRWSWEVLDTLIVPDVTDPQEVIVKGRLTVYMPDGGQIVKVQFGGSDVKRFKNGNAISLADDLKAASSDALKKAASLLGVGLDLYDDEPAQAPQERQEQRNGHKPTNGKANGATALPSWRSPAEAQTWAWEQVDASGKRLFNHAAHVSNAYAKVKAEQAPKTAGDMWAAWVAYVEDKRAVANGDNDEPF